MRGSRVQAVVQRTAGREDRHHPVVAGQRDLHRQRAGAGRSRQGGDRRGRRPHRSGGAGRAAVAGHRPPRPERAPRLAADRLADRHPDRSRGIASAARRNSPSAPQLFMEALDVDEIVAQLLASEGFATVEEVAYVELDETRRDRRLRRGHRGGDADPRPRISGERSKPSWTTSARSWASRTSCWKSPASPRPCWWRSARTASRPSRTWPAVRPTTWSAGPNARTARRRSIPGVLASHGVSRADAEEDGAARPQGWLDHRRRACGRRCRFGDEVVRCVRMEPHRTEPAPRTRSTIRTCIVTRRQAEPDELIRFVVGPDLAVVPDLKRNLPGRGCWVTPTAYISKRRAAKKLFARAFKAQVTVPPDLGGMVDGLLSRSALGMLGLARKAGAISLGPPRSRARCAAGWRFSCFMRPRRPMMGCARSARRDGQPSISADLPTLAYKLFSEAELSLALGGTNVIHAAVLAGDAGRAVLNW